MRHHFTSCPLKQQIGFVGLLTSAPLIAFVTMMVGDVLGGRSFHTFELMATLAISTVCWLLAFYLAHGMLGGLDHLKSSLDDKSMDAGAERAAAGLAPEIVALLTATNDVKARVKAETEASLLAGSNSVLAAQRREVLDDVARQIGANVDELVIDMNIACQDLLATVEALSGNAADTQIQMVTTSQRLATASGNIFRVADSIRGLASTTREIASQSSTAAIVADKARVGTSRVRDLMSTLQGAVLTVGDMGGQIAAIADQTNLLALNAAIEAARAGEAGRGFAVVASEVKSLAGQTSKATAEIAGQIAAIRSAVTAVAETIEQVVGVVDDITNVSTAIAAATEQQTVATDEINFNVEETSNDSQAVAAALSDVTQKSIDTSHHAGALTKVAHDLSNKADEVERTLARLISDLKAA